MKKVALVTGANKGIGFETAKQLAHAGVHVILASRDAEKGAAAAKELTDQGLDISPLTLDVGDSSSIAAAVKAIGEKHGRLDILVNNAGVAMQDGTTKVSEERMDTWRKTFDTNVFGLIAVTQAFMPLLEKSAAARIVNLSSILGSLTLHSDPKSPIYDFKVAAYNVSKSAVNAYTVQLAWELRNSPIKVNAAHPGHVKTDMGGASAPMDIEEGAKTSVALALLGADGSSGTFVHLGKSLPW